MSFSASKAEYVLYVFPDSLGTETLEDIKGKISKSSFNDWYSSVSDSFRNF